MATKLALKELIKRPERLTPGHRLCAGCGASIIVRQVLAAIDDPVVIANATGCLEVATTVYPYTAWQVPWIHSAFENASATVSGVEAAYRSLVRQNKIPEQNIKFITFGGDGATYDIGLQSLSGALERGHQFLYVCYDNGAYMNTGTQRSSATPCGAYTTTSPVSGSVLGKQEPSKDLTHIIAAHGIPYVAQAAPSRWRDLMKKTRKAIQCGGPAFMNVLSSCNRGWRHGTDETVEVTQLAVDTCYWPLYEVEHGEWRLTYRPTKKLPVEEWLVRQGRFDHLFDPGNHYMIDELQRLVDRRWARLLKRCNEAEA
jgi:pyruvate ferredoxin oxidoreductase beta subunit